MQTLDKLFKETFLLNSCIEIEDCGDDQTYLLKNVFKDINAVLDFTSLLTKWESTCGAKPGIETLHLPCWTSLYVVRQLMECPQIGIDLIEDEIDGWMNNEHNGITFNYFYYNNHSKHGKKNKSLVSNNCLLPHSDPVFGYSNYVILVNLNDRPVRTCFWTLDGKRRVDTQEEVDYASDYCSGFTLENMEDKFKEGRLKKQQIVEYGFNEGIIYNSNRLHSPIIDEYWTRENPRSMLRICIPGADLEDYADSLNQ